MVMIRIITAVMIIAKYSLPTIDFATRYSTRYSDFLLQPYSNPTRSQKRLLVGPCLYPPPPPVMTSFMNGPLYLFICGLESEFQA